MHKLYLHASFFVHRGPVDARLQCPESIGRVASPRCIYIYIYIYTCIMQ